MLKDLSGLCTQRVHIVRSKPKAVQQDVNSTFTAMKEEVRVLTSLGPCSMHTNDSQWMSLCQHTGIKGFYIAMHGSIEDLNDPKVFFTEKVERFVTDVLNMEPQHLALKLKAWTMSGLSGMSTVNRIKAFAYQKSGSLLHQCGGPTRGCKQSQNQMISDCHKMIQKGLGQHL